MQKPTDVMGRRVAAVLIDALLLFAIFAISWYALTEDVGTGICLGGGLELGGDCRAFLDETKRSIWILIIIVAYLGALWILPGITGKTPGKAAVGIKIIKENGRPPGIGWMLLRIIVGVVDSIGAYLVGFIVAMTDENHQRIADKACSTYVVEKNATSPFPAGGPGGQQQFAQPPAAGWGGPPQQAPPQPQAQQTKADWYPDPHGKARLRYWDGQSWTEHTSN
jgi:uncharacterized RDD family membrane protein YckC